MSSAVQPPLSELRDRPVSECPHCEQLRGRPVQVTVHTGMISTQFRCDACGHLWEHYRPDAAVQPA